ncbi:palmitoyl-protein thioesterase 1-like [Tropilaelaps mercedesae]|uniref:Palmitoyl-protein thioesterase 1 n=1 Tax=Tropilaelaps mercedesae TaxID=418985 RepID=A0A1V9XA18_9ACAR|nr:palmitoyl-protein thioesterase 1-like [Tropilaelaps mercedesae]
MRSVLVKNLCLLSLLTQSLASASTPIVLWHGLGDTCCNPLSLGGFAEYLTKQLNGTKVLSLKIGSSFMDEMKNSYLMNSNDQVKQACEIIGNDPDLANGYHAIGFSQGGQFMRALAQRCPEPPIKVLVSLGGQHQGVYGLPRCPGSSSSLCEYVRRVLDYGAYWSWVQGEVVPAQYWHDPTDEATYRANSIFLADINNENRVNESYRDNLKKLEKLVLVKFGADTVVQPRESSWFGWYKPGQDQVVMDWKETTLYKEDTIGLKALDEAGKVDLIEVSGADHLQMSEEWFTENIVKKYF